jgi:hypothetical protein
VRVRTRRFKDLLFTDVSGPRAPHDFQEQGEIAMISAKMVLIDPEVLDRVRAVGDKTLVGQRNSTGLVLGVNNYFFQLWVDGTNDRPHHFFSALLWEDEDELFGTRRTEDDIMFYAWAFIGPDATTAKDTQLFEYIRPPGVA